MSPITRCFCTIFAIAAAATAAPVLELGFDDLPPERSVPGLSGQAFRGGGPSATRGVPLPTESLDLRQGTLSFWVQPLDWQGNDGLYHYFINGKLGASGYWIFYKSRSPGTGLFFGWDPSEGAYRRYNLHQSILDWKPGEWHHIAGTWSDRDRVTLWLDGVRVGLTRGIHLPENDLLPDSFAIGGAQADHPGETAIDELKLFDRALTPAEILALYATHATPEQVAAAEAKLPPADDIPSVVLVHSPLDHRLLLTFRTDCLGEDTPVAAATLTVTGAAGAATDHDVIIAGGEGRLDLDTSDWPNGSYTGVLRLRDAAGQPLGETTRVIREVTDDTWETIADIGREPRVPPPFRSVRVDGAAVTASTARIELGGGGLPRSVQVLGQEILAGPVRLIADDVELPEAAAPEARGGDDGEARFRGGLGGVTIDSRVEFDNLCWFEAMVPADVAVAAQGLRLEIPLRREFADSLNVSLEGVLTSQRIAGFRAVPEGDGLLWSHDAFSPALWVGGDGPGIGWFAESDQFWDTAEGPKYELVGEGDRVVIRITFRRTPHTGPMTLRFGLQPTPVRELEPGWRRGRWLPSAQTTTHFLTLKTDLDAPLPDTPPNGETVYLYAFNEFCNTLPNQPEVFAKQVARARGLGLFAVPYTDILYRQETSGIGLLHGDAMDAEPGARFVTPDSTAVSVLPVGKARDYYVWYAHHLAREYGLNGFYVDEAWVHPATGPAELGAGYVGEDGKRHPTWPLLARREMLRRLRNVFAAEGRPFRIILHLSAFRFPPLVSMGDHLLLGEELYTHVTRDPIYAHTVTPELARAAYLPGSMGIPTVMLPQFKASGARVADPAAATGFLAVMLPHDLLIWPVFIQADTVLAARDALVSAGVDRAETRFIGYWHDRPPAKSAPDGVLVSAWRMPDGTVAVVVANPTDTARDDAVVVLDPEVLGPEVVRQVTACLPGDVTTHDGTVTLDLAAQSLQILRLGE